MMRLECIQNELPPDFSALRDAAQAEGHLLLDRLTTDWASGDLRFARPGEKLLVVRIAEKAFGLGGVTLDPTRAPALRMRRFYVLNVARRQGVGRALVTALVKDLAPDRMIYVHAGISEAFRFWNAVGFQEFSGDRVTHRANVQDIRDAII